MLRIQLEEPASLRSIEFGRGAECQRTHHDSRSTGNSIFVVSPSARNAEHRRMNRAAIHSSVAFT
jgi:hypothetical protein